MLNKKHLVEDKLKSALLQSRHEDTYFRTDELASILKSCLPDYEAIAKEILKDEQTFEETWNLDKYPCDYEDCENNWDEVYITNTGERLRVCEECAEEMPDPPYDPKQKAENLLKIL